MANEDEATRKICFTKKRIRLSRVVDKLAVLRNGNLLANRENNNVSVSQPRAAALVMTPQLGSTDSQANPFIPQAASGMSPALLQLSSTALEVISVLPESGCNLKQQQNYFLYGLPSSVPPSFLSLARLGFGGGEPLENHHYQQAPLDLSFKGCGRDVKSEQKQKCSKSAGAMGQLVDVKARPSRAALPKGSGVAYPIVRGDVASLTTRENAAARYNQQVSPVFEQMPWTCSVCGQLFRQRDQLAKHVALLIRGRSPSRSHICHECNRGFSRSDSLRRHLRLHTGQKPYRCAACGQTFPRLDYLATHRRTHTGEKPYKCSQCPYAARRRDTIIRHMRTHHSSRMQPASDSSDSGAP